jgi:RNA-binding protein
MNELSGKEKKALRARGQRLQACANIGKAGLTEGVIENLSMFLGREGLIKIKLPAVDPTERKRLSIAAAELTNSALVAAVGRSILLYRTPDPKPEKTA